MLIAGSQRERKESHGGVVVVVVVVFQYFPLLAYSGIIAFDFVTDSLSSPFAFWYEREEEEEKERQR
ncbi:hypothetical protein M0804_001461 [Polistes exclamans]|nr:hypothetical protein M0804_001461 [Polistes exclamans]